MPTKVTLELIMNDRTLYESETNKSSVIMNVITPSSKSLIQIF